VYCSANPYIYWASICYMYDIVIMLDVIIILYQMSIEQFSLLMLMYKHTMKHIKNAITCNIHLNI